MGLETEVQESSMRHKEAKTMLGDDRKNEGEPRECDVLVLEAE